MSYWSSFGRQSPWGRAPPETTPEVERDDYSYIRPEDIVDPPSYRQDDYHQLGRRGPVGDHHDDASIPDVIQLKYKNQRLGLQFPAYSISEGRLKVSDVRRQARLHLDVSDSYRIRLIYKGRELKDDAAAAGEEGLKQNSEVTVVVTNNDYSDSEDSADGEDQQANTRRQDTREESADGRRATANGKRKGKKSGNKSKRSPPATSPQYDSSTDPYDLYQTRSNNSTLRPQPSVSKEASRQPTPDPSSANGPGPNVFDPRLPSNKPLPAAFKQLADLEQKFRSEFAGPLDRLVSNPPSDTKKRDLEALRLNEMIERDILLKTDEIDTEGRDDIRQKRKQLVREAQEALNKLDAAKKRWSK